jgi:hypothetical protein
VRASVQRLIEFGVIEWEAGLGRSKPSLLSLPPEGKGGPTVVRLSKEEKRTDGGPPFSKDELGKPVPRGTAGKPAPRGTDTREEVLREENLRPLPSELEQRQEQNLQRGKLERSTDTSGDEAPDEEERERLQKLIEQASPKEISF